MGGSNLSIPSEYGIESMADATVSRPVGGRLIPDAMSK
jgi:hypothetical protein